MIISNSVKNVLIKMTYNQITVHMIFYISTKCVKSLTSVPMALRKYLFPFRTQKSSSAAAIILPQAGN
jgi:hypothetical protein